MVQERKKKIVAEFAQLMQEYPVIAAVNMENLPSKTVQRMRESLRGKVILKMTKRRLLNIAIDEAAKTKPGLEKLKDYLKGMPAIMCTHENPFSLYKTLEKNKSSAPIKGGQVAPNDIIVPAGPTGFAPGPIIGQLGQFKIKAGIEGGKVVIKEDSLVAKEGDVVGEELAGILTRLGIEPMQIGMTITGAYEDGMIYDKNILSVDEQEYLDNITQGHRWAFNLAMEAGIFTDATTELMVQNAHADARSLALECNILEKGVVEEILAKAQRQANAVQQLSQ
ncbi:50S ribosomal protein L10 [Candidatus Woesearchaeota archaeon]|jgi:large subunit ribosomal protein L10|nr:MAG: 50S ribosomal protein L10 [Candidatus Woesearchaeota archaeon]